MTTTTATSFRYFTRPKATPRTVSRPGYLKRFRTYIEYSPWEERLLSHEAKADRLCLGVLIAAGFCLAPVLIRIFLR